MDGPTTPHPPPPLPALKLSSTQLYNDELISLLATEVENRCVICECVCARACAFLCVCEMLRDAEFSKLV